jgi:hypothetical protein
MGRISSTKSKVQNRKAKFIRQFAKFKDTKEATPEGIAS